MNKKIAFIGVGNMATAILNGITSGEKCLVPWTDVVLFDKYAEKLDRFSSRGASVADTLEEAVSYADCVFLCVKPQNFPEILPVISDVEGVGNKLFVTIAAGISIGKIAEFTHGAPIVRVMPNTPMLIGHGVSALCRSENVSDMDFDFVCDVFSSASKVIRIKECEMNRIISVSGSSPAYVFMMIKAMYEGAVEQGLLDGDLSERDILEGICDTIIGSAMLMKAGDKTPDEQIKMVCSKGGTTERAVAALEEYDFYKAFSVAMRKCTERADELGSAK